MRLGQVFTQIAGEAGFGLYGAYVHDRGTGCFQPPLGQLPLADVLAPSSDVKVRRPGARQFNDADIADGFWPLPTFHAFPDVAPRLGQQIELLSWRDFGVNADSEGEKP